MMQCNNLMHAALDLLSNPISNEALQFALRGPASGSAERVSHKRTVLVIALSHIQQALPVRTLVASWIVLPHSLLLLGRALL